MKTCTKCGESKNATDYFVRDKKTGRLHAQCKVCYQIHRANYHTAHYAKYKKEYLLRARLRNRKRRAEYQTNIVKYLSDKTCFDCDEQDIRVLEFDHIDPATKLFNISQAVKLGYSWEDTLKEINKCRTLCANCHKKRTAKQFHWHKAK